MPKNVTFPKCIGYQWNKDFNKYAKRKANSLKKIYKLDQWARKMTKQYV